MKPYGISSYVVFEAVGGLRAIGLSALARLLGRSLPTDGGHFLDLWLDIDERPTARRRHGIAEMNDEFIFRTHFPKTLLGEIVLSAPVPTRRRDVARDALMSLWRRMALWERPRPAAPGGDLLGDAIVTTAFGAPSFEIAALGLVREAISERVLMHPDGPPATPPAPQTVIAIAISAGRPAASSERAWDRLNEISRRMSDQAGWAGFWDIWLLTEARREASFTLPTDYEEFSDLGGRAAEDLENVPDHPWLRPGWREDAPAYAVSLMSGRA